MSLENKTAIVTGAARGIGLACARRLAEEGARVVLADVEEDAGVAAAQEIADDGHEVRFMACDVAERLDVRNLVTGTVEAYGGIDVLINNAGIVIGGDFLELSEEDAAAYRQTAMDAAWAVTSENAGAEIAAELRAMLDN